MKKLNLTVGYVGLDGVVLKEHSAFKKGEVVIVISAESFDDFFNELNEIKKDLEKSKEWIDDIKGK
jgi:hypothetical protein